VDGLRNARAHRSYCNLGRSRGPMLIVKPSLGLTQTSTPDDGSFPAGPASKHAAAHFGVWNADGDPASATTATPGAVSVSRTSAASRLNCPSVEGRL
jgi:hypothetical protein